MKANLRNNYLQLAIMSFIAIGMALLSIPNFYFEMFDSVWIYIWRTISIIVAFAEIALIVTFILNYRKNLTKSSDVYIGMSLIIILCVSLALFVTTEILKSFWAFTINSGSGMWSWNLYVIVMVLGWITLSALSLSSVVGILGAFKMYSSHRKQTNFIASYKNKKNNANKPVDQKAPESKLSKEEKASNKAFQKEINTLNKLREQNKITEEEYSRKMTKLAENN